MATSKIPRARKHLFNSPFEEYLGTSLSFHPPSKEHSRQTMQTFLSEIDDDIAEIDTDIAAVESQLAALTLTIAALRDEKQSALRYRDLHLSLFPPIHDLPSHILFAIFKLVISGSQSSWNALDSKTGGPWFLGKICHRWRALVWSSPSLWAGPFRVDSSSRSFGPSYGQRICNEETRKELLDEVLKRANSSPLQISISTSHLSEKLSEDLAAHASHWGDISLVGPYEGLLEFLNHIDPADMLVSQLSKLTLCNRGPVVAKQNQLSELMKRVKVPALRTLSITSSLEVVPSNVEFPCNRLNSLRFSLRTSIETVWWILDSCTDLQALDATLLHDPDVITKFTRSHEGLLSLSTESTALLKYIRFPALEILKLDRDLTPRDLDALRRCVKESGMTLRNLHIFINGTESAAMWKEALTSFLSTVEDLDITTLDDFSLETLRSLIVSGDTPTILPRLARLTIENRTSRSEWRSELWMETLFDMLFSRLPSEPGVGSNILRLRRVAIDWTRMGISINDVDRGKFKHLAAFRKEGFNVHVSDKGSEFVPLACISHVHLSRVGYMIPNLQNAGRRYLAEAANTYHHTKHYKGLLLNVDYYYYTLPPESQLVSSENRRLPL